MPSGVAVMPCHLRWRTFALKCKKNKYACLPASLNLYRTIICMNIGFWMISRKVQCDAIIVPDTRFDGRSSSASWCLH